MTTKNVPRPLDRVIKRSRGRLPQPQPEKVSAFARTLRLERTRRGLTLDALGKLCGVPARSLSHYERGQQPPLSAALAVARALGFSLDGLEDSAR